MDDYCVGTMRTARKNYICRKLKIHPYSVHGSRVTQHWGDSWRYDLKLKCYGNPLIADENTFSRHETPIQYYLCKTFDVFKSAFMQKDDNYKKGLIFRNQFFWPESAGNLCEGFFLTRNNREQNMILSKSKI
jgi:hypothetical protein